MVRIVVIIESAKDVLGVPWSSQDGEDDEIAKLDQHLAGKPERRAGDFLCRAYDLG